MTVSSTGGTKKNIVLIIATASGFIVPFLTSSINVALPKMGSELHMEAVAMSCWEWGWSGIFTHRSRERLHKTRDQVLALTGQHPQARIGLENLAEAMAAELASRPTPPSPSAGPGR